VAISFDNALGTYEAALKLRSKRAEVLASNLANADTPNYKARDFDFHKVLDSQLSSAVKGGNIDAKVNNMMQYRTPSQPSIDGNTVDEHIEHAAYMENNLEFQTAFTLLNSRFKGLTSAIRGD
jgi:flagellar basal-body rod protein FlgB